MSLKVPEKCLCCGAEWVGGHQRPGEPMKEGSRVLYDCGASMSMKRGSYEDRPGRDFTSADRVWSWGVYRILFKNCLSDKPPTAEDVRGILKRGK